MSFDTQTSTDERRQNRSTDVGMDPSGDLSVASANASPSKDESEREEEYQKAIQALVDRTYGLIDEARRDASATTEVAGPAGDVRRIPPSPKQPVSPSEDTHLPAPARAISPETSVDIQSLREVARSSARQAIDLHRLQNLSSSACGKLLLATLALCVCVAAQFLSPRPSSTAMTAALVAWLAAALWTAQYVAATRELSKLFASTLRDWED